jgi:sec-independent protein translocase protein TatC
MAMPRPARADFGSAPDGRLELRDHIRELRYRLLVSAAAVIVASIVAFAFHGELLRVLTHPYCGLPDHYRAIQGRCSLVVTGVTDAFTVTLKLSLYAGIVLSSPIWLYQLWRFVTPALYRHERRLAGAFVSASTVLFAAGVAFSYITLARGLRFLLGFATGGVSALLSFSSYLSFVTSMALVFAVSFEFPLLVVMLNFAGVLSAARLRRWSRTILFGIVVFAAVATPSQDPFTMLGLVIPICLLYGLAFAIASIHDRRASARQADSDELDELAANNDEVAAR